MALSGCGSTAEVLESAVYQSISPEEAFQRLENEEQITLLGRRSLEVAEMMQELGIPEFTIWEGSLIGPMILCK